MAIKELVYAVKQQLESATQQSFRHSHVYELLAASFGFSTRASLDATHVIAVAERAYQPSAADLGALQSRLTELGYQQVADSAGAVLLSVIADHRLWVATVESVIELLKLGRWAHPDGWPEVEDDVLELEAVGSALPELDLGNFAMLVDGLNAAAARNGAAAHYALALIYRGEDLSEEVGSAYWYSLMEQGRALEGIELEWAMAYKNGLRNAEREVLHLNEAARLGWSDARLDIALERAQCAEERDDFEQAEHWYKEAADLGHVGAMRSLSWLAESVDDSESAWHWNHQAALCGDLDAMRSLIDEDDEKNLFQNWVWVYLAEQLGTDLRVSTLRAYHDGGMYAGQAYDDDQGGPLYVDGDEGVHLEPLSASDDVRARAEARELLNRIKHP